MKLSQLPLPGLPRIGVAVVVAGVAACLAAERTTPAFSSPGDKFPPVSALPAKPELPDPLVMLDGRRIATRDQWFKERHPELIALVQHYMYGAMPPRPENVFAKLAREDRHAVGGKATLKEVTVTFGPPELRPMHLMLVVPNRRQRPAPVVLSMNYFGNHTLLRDPAIALSTNWMPERGTGVVNNLSTEASRGTWADIWRIEYLINRGYALATFYNGDIDPDRPDARGIQDYFRKFNPKLDCATIAAWAWGLSRAVDYLVTDADLDKQRIVVTGHSRLGKAALLAAALDRRIALAIPHQAGSGGSAPSRTGVQPAVSSRRQNTPYPLKAPETVRQINDKFPHWFNARFREFSDQPERLPFDQHCLVALCAPRPVLFTNGRDDTWINPDGQFEVLRAAAPVYRLLGAGDFAATQPPPDGQLIDSTLGFFLRPGGHSLRPEDWKAFLDFADRHLGPSGKPHAASLRHEYLGYEYLPGQPTERKQVHHTDKVRRIAWRIVCAGGYFAAGFNGTIGHNDIWNRIDAPNRYTFTVRDAGAAAQLSALHEFFTALPFWRMEPLDGLVTGAEALVLAEPGNVYVLYLTHGGKASVDLSAAKGSLTAQWFNPRDGSVGDSFGVAAKRTETFQAPDAQDWVPRLHRGRDKP